MEGESIHTNPQAEHEEELEEFDHISLSEQKETPTTQGKKKFSTATYAARTARATDQAYIQNVRLRTGTARAHLQGCGGREDILFVLSWRQIF